ncbi:hypothetical protein POJ06DRAFT_256495 [Lipomyces tetrasporus]|uniref:U3 small nucleolar RNA-associated protein 25 n=1 Tax=Lipomyces tetrasporus TaxID=54092 RepID=A0AAD7QQ10_9ASCO|nr:uncharacterized protein POJ06DRAFT_256495 [Lipomyces tetrasporus]KAJ8099269.1 hypothetical protein POJ06DRAFT_256495 [Lipomyces tetrasporus]
MILSRTAMTKKEFAAKKGNSVSQSVKKETPELSRSVGDAGHLDIKSEREEDTSEFEHEVEEDDEESDSSNPFQYHFANTNEALLKRMVNHAQSKEWTTEKLRPTANANGKTSKYSMSVQRPGSLKFHEEIKSSAANLNDLKIKKRLVSPFLDVNKKHGSDGGIFSNLQKSLIPPIFSNEDLLFAPRSISNAQEIQIIYSLHALNHIFQTRDTVFKDNARLSKLQRSDKNFFELRDQGFTRPKVLVVLPTRNACHHFVETLIRLSGTSQQENLKRFKTTYYSNTALPKTKPEDFRQLFAGNNDDNFRIGLKFTRKTLKLFTEFYNSDLIVASPLGLRLAIGDKTDKKRDVDFLSSIEVVIVDQTSAITMQNWDHMLQIFTHLNLIPKDSHGCDFSRIRNWYLDGESKYLRQTLVFAEFITPEINALFSHQMHNIGGKVKFHPVYSGVLTDIGAKLDHVFMKFFSSSPQEDPEKRFKYFTTKALPSLMRTTSASSSGTLIFIPSYVDYVRIRNYLEQEHQINKKLGASGFSFAAINEYSSVSDVTRARALFKDGQSKVLLYTERLHHFRRYEIKGAETIFMYGLPDNPTFYVEIVRFLLRSVSDGRADKGAISVKSMFSKWDALKLERIVGTSRVAKMCAGSGEVFEFS